MNNFVDHANACGKEVQDVLDRYNLSLVFQEIRHNGQLVQGNYIFVPRPPVAKEADKPAESGPQQDGTEPDPIPSGKKKRRLRSIK